MRRQLIFAQKLKHIYRAQKCTNVVLLYMVCTYVALLYIMCTYVTLLYTMCTNVTLLYTMCTYVTLLYDMYKCGIIVRCVPDRLIG